MCRAARRPADRRLTTVSSKAAGFNWVIPARRHQGITSIGAGWPPPRTARLRGSPSVASASAGAELKADPGVDPSEKRGPHRRAWIDHSAVLRHLGKQHQPVGDGYREAARIRELH